MGRETGKASSLGSVAAYWSVWKCFSTPAYTPGTDFLPPTGCMAQPGSSPLQSRLCFWHQYRQRHFSCLSMLKANTTAGRYVKPILIPGLVFRFPPI